MLLKFSPILGFNFHRSDFSFCVLVLFFLPPPSPQHHLAQPPQQLQQQHQPPVFNIKKSDFREVVQKLTGSPAHERFTTPPPIQPEASLQRLLHRTLWTRITQRCSPRTHRTSGGAHVEAGYGVVAVTSPVGINRREKRKRRWWEEMTIIPSVKAHVPHMPIVLSGF